MKPLVPIAISRILGKGFGRLTVTEFVGWSSIRGNRKSRPLVRAKCLCGGEIITRAESIYHGITKSCGCLRDEKLSRMSGTHRKSDMPEHSLWQSMKSRCSNPNVQSYPYYGGRGIAVCDRWLGKTDLLTSLPIWDLAQTKHTHWIE